MVQDHFSCYMGENFEVQFVRSARVVVTSFIHEILQFVQKLATFQLSEKKPSKCKLIVAPPNSAQRRPTIVHISTSVHRQMYKNV